MIPLQNVSYCRLGTRDLDTARLFATSVLGLQVADESKKTVSLRADQRAQTLC